MFKKSIFQMLNVDRKELSWKVLSLSLGVRIYVIHPFLYLLVFVLNMKIQQTVKFYEHNFMIPSEGGTEKMNQTTLTEHNFALHMLCWVPDWTYLFPEFFLKNFFRSASFQKGTHESSNCGSLDEHKRVKCYQKRSNFTISLFFIKLPFVQLCFHSIS